MMLGDRRPNNNNNQDGKPGTASDDDQWVNALFWDSHNNHDNNNNNELPATIHLGGLDTLAAEYQPAIPPCVATFSKLLRALKQSGGDGGNSNSNSNSNSNNNNTTDSSTSFTQPPPPPQRKHITKFIIGEQQLWALQKPAELNQLVAHLGYLPQLTWLEVASSTSTTLALSVSALAECLTRARNLETLIVWGPLRLTTTEELQRWSEALTEHPTLRHVHLLELLLVRNTNNNNNNGNNNHKPLPLYAENGPGGTSHTTEPEHDNSHGPKPTITTLTPLLKALASIPHLQRLQLSSTVQPLQLKKPNAKIDNHNININHNHNNNASSLSPFRLPPHDLYHLVQETSRLQVLVLHHWGLRHEHAQSLARGLRGNATLVHLDVRFNPGLSASSLEALLQSLQECNLQYLDYDVPPAAVTRTVKRGDKPKSQNDDDDNTTTDHDFVLPEEPGALAPLPMLVDADSPTVRIHKLLQLHCQLNRAGRFTLLKDPNATPQQQCDVLCRLVEQARKEDVEAEQVVPFRSWNRNPRRHSYHEPPKPRYPSLDILFGFLTTGSNPLELLNLLARDEEEEEEA